MNRDVIMPRPVLSSVPFSKALIATFFSIALSACGGGSDSEAPTPPPPPPVLDTTPPVITLNGNASMTLPYNSAYNEQGATAVDDVDGNVDVTISGAVDNAQLGEYTLTYSATDSSGNTASTSRMVSVIDTTAPVITLNGDASMALSYNAAYREQGATAEEDVTERTTGTTNKLYRVIYKE